MFRVFRGSCSFCRCVFGFIVFAEFCLGVVIMFVSLCLSGRRICYCVCMWLCFVCRR